MPKTGYINARVNERTKNEAKKVLNELDMSITEAINLFLKQVALHKGLPFEVRIPNKETITAMRELNAGKGARHSGSTKAFLQGDDDL